MASTIPRSYKDDSDSVAVIGAESEMQRLLDALDDADCREILAMTSDNALTANEISDTGDLPLSTTYRKLEMLTNAGLLEERTRIRQSGKHASEYARLVDDIGISVGNDEGIELKVSRRERSERTFSLR